MKESRENKNPKSVYFGNIISNPTIKQKEDMRKNWEAFVIEYGAFMPQNIEWKKILGLS